MTHGRIPWDLPKSDSFGVEAVAQPFLTVFNKAIAGDDKHDLAQSN
jgi:hypothetical protein